ncbi:Gfo/Idh/MocA family protein [Allorhodopirellula solitaria]|uniref:Putative oxidoreductase YcjS n=1 Tax=Allorhodopirellula solitaria TaxID=2527987 RepID=A0A5C5YJV5_9BACT|nr:Gfo/Idh/MocA family oxidoreductase [Allorhodopirellula solitaria]TWT75170.1 putative oxidoreductase YcjS [Allorhodopirellula solitaria]
MTDHQQHQRDRRLFLKGSAAIGGAMLSRTVMGDTSSEASSDKPASANETQRVAIIGVNNRGSALAKGFIANPDSDVVCICDVDSRAAEKAANMIEERSQRRPEIETDIRKVLDRAEIDAIVVATPNHWHAPATIMGCAAGKHVYVEKPCSHTAEEGVWAVEAARKHDRTVMMGSQRRSWPAVIKAIEMVQSGRIGKAAYARTWYNNRRPSIGHGKQVATPDWLNWELWQGPAPRQSYLDNLVHYNWHWKWRYGNGELGNNGIHMLDLARWGLEVNHPNRVTAGGGKYRHDDDQETPDTMMVTYDFPESKSITWEGISWSPLGPFDSQVGVSFHGSAGSLVILGTGYTLFDDHNKEIETVSDSGGDTTHIAEFLDCIESGRRPNADIAEAHRSTLLCHLGNMAYRTQSTLQVDPKTGKPQNDSNAQSMWGREYAKGWKPQV